MVTYASDEPLAKIARFLGVFRLNEKTTRSRESLCILHIFTQELFITISHIESPFAHHLLI